MKNRHRNTEDSTPETKRLGRARSMRLRYGAAAGALIVLVALGLTLTLPRHRGRGWPEMLRPGSAAGFNVLVVTLDTTRADRLGCYGYAAAETPVLDALAAEGVRFGDAVTNVPITLPAHATIFTGLDPPNHGVRDNGEYSLGTEHITLAEITRDAGYETAAFVSAFVLDARFGLDQGFNLYDDKLTVAPSTTAAAFGDPHERPAGAVTGATIRWLTGRKRDRPFFCWVHYFDPHYPYTPPPPFAARFGDRPYDGEIAYMDEQLGVLLQALETIGSKDHTLLVVVGDHGEALGDHGEINHSKLIYESTMWVPLIISCPSLFQGPHLEDDAVVSIADIFPTILELLAIEDGKPRDGRSLVSARADPDRSIYLETLAPYFDHGWSPLYGLRRHEDKYILAPRPEYYDLNSDPNELNNLYDRVSGAALTARDMLAGELSLRLAKWPSIRGVVAAAEKLDSETIQRLQSLGYVGTMSETDPDEELPDPKDMMMILRNVDRATWLGRKGRYQQALALIQQAAALSPRDPRVLTTMGKLYVQVGRIEEAHAIFRTAIANSTNSSTPVQAAQIMLGAAQPAIAVEFLEPLCESQPDNVNALVNLGITYLSMRRLEEARETLLRAEQLDDKRVETYINLAICCRHLTRPAEALDYADRAVELDPEIAEAHTARGVALLQLQRNEEALEALTTAATLNANDPRIQEHLADVCMRLGQYPEALVYYRRLAKMLPTRFEPQLGLAEVNLLMQRFDDAEAAVRLGLQMTPDEPRLLALAATLSELKGRRSSVGE